MGAYSGSPPRTLSRLRVLLDTTYARRAPFSGTAIYVECLPKALEARGEVEIVTRSNPRRRPPAGGGVGSARNLLADQWWTAVELPRLARELSADLIHHPLPAVAPFGAPAQVITVHDLAFERLPGCFDRRFRAYVRFVHRAAARRASAVICVSETTAADVRELWSVPAERIVVAHHGPGQGFDMSSPQPPRHFLYVGDDEPRKDVATLLAAYRLYRQREQSPLELVLAGSAHGDGVGIRSERRPSSARLAELYAGAAALVHPSLYEGFGLTLLEAMRGGVPVIAARVAGAAEVCDHAIRYAEPQNPASFAREMAEIAAKPAVREELAARGRRRAASFTWDASARAHRDAYSLALGEWHS